MKFFWPMTNSFEDVTFVGDEDFIYMYDISLHEPEFYAIFPGAYSFRTRNT